MQRDRAKHGVDEDILPNRLVVSGGHDHSPDERRRQIARIEQAFIEHPLVRLRDGQRALVQAIPLGDGVPGRRGRCCRADVGRIGHDRIRRDLTADRLEASVFGDAHDELAGDDRDPVDDLLKADTAFVGRFETELAVVVPHTEGA
jgi:hypothetical protein